MLEGDELLSYRRGAEATRCVSTVLVQWVLTGASKDEVANEISIGGGLMETLGARRSK